MPDLSEAIKALVRSYADIRPDDAEVQLLELQKRALEIEAENMELLRENEELRRLLARKKAMETFGGASYILEPDGGKTGPVCPRCYNRDEVVSILEGVPHGARCAVCGARYPGVRASVEGPRQRVY